MQNIILSQEQIQEICKNIGGKICQELHNEDKIPLFVGVLKGSLNFMMDLMKHINIPIYTDYVQISSYQGMNRSNEVKLIKDLSFNCKGRTVIIVEDIVDTGHSMKFLLETIKAHNPKRILTVALFNKEKARVVDVKVDFVGYELVDNTFLIGYGLDYNEMERNVPYVYGATYEDLERLNLTLDKDLGRIK